MTSKRKTGIWPMYTFPPGHIQAVFYCRHASDPEDLAHGMAPGSTEQICTCGSRDLRFERVGPFWWPMRLYWLSDKTAVSHYIVPSCVTRGVDDPTHAPMKIAAGIRGLSITDEGERVVKCICGFEPTVDDLRALPAY